jgi:hypothetical protein
MVVDLASVFGNQRVSFDRNSATVPGGIHPASAFLFAER